MCFSYFQAKQLMTEKTKGGLRSTVKAMLLSIANYWVYENYTLKGTMISPGKKKFKDTPIYTAISCKYHI